MILSQRMRKKNLLIGWLILIFILAAFLRFWSLGINPPSLTWDEAAWGYNAYSLGLTAQDEYGRFLPWDYLESFGDFKPPVYAYLTILPVKIFGFNEFATRFASALLGTLTVLLTYYLVNELFINELRKDNKLVNPLTRNKLIALTASFLLAISPWHIMLSRAAFEANVASFFIIGGVAAFLRGIKYRGWWLILAAASFALSLQTFNTARVVSPLLVLLLLIGFRKKLWSLKKWLFLAFLTGFIILAPAISFYLTPQAKLRFKEVNIFSDSSVVGLANQEMENDNWAWWSRIIHNRRWAFAREYLRHYFDHFNPAFLFIKGDGNPKFSTQDVGELYLWEWPFLLAGILILFRKRPGYWWLIPFWLLVGILPAATARETPHALRIETTLPTWQILSAFGLVEFWQLAKRQKKLINYGLRITSWGLIIIGFVYFQHGLWRHYPVEYAHEWQYGYKEAVEYLKSVEDKYHQIWFTDKLGRPYIYFLFYLKADPREFQQNSVVKRDVFGFVEVKNFGKYHFYRLDEMPPGQNILVVDKAENIPENVEVLKTFYLPNGKENLKAYVL